MAAGASDLLPGEPSSGFDELRQTDWAASLAVATRCDAKTDEYATCPYGASPRPTPGSASPPVTQV